MPLARPQCVRFAFAEDTGVTPIELPRRRRVLLGALLVTAMFAVFAGVLAAQIHNLRFDSRDVFGLAMTLFMLFWIAGWSVGVLVLGALTLLLWGLLVCRESFDVRDGCLVMAQRIGPLRMGAEYCLAEIRNLRLEPASNGARVRFDYGEGSRGLGDAMPRADAERVVAMIRSAMPAAPRVEPEAASAVAAPGPALEARPPLPAPALALVAANLVPLAGVLLAGWRLDQIMVLFWAESAVVALYTLAKMAVVGRWLALPGGVFFLAHFGGFMAIHFLFVYEIFVRGLGAKGAEPPLGEALAGVFVPLWPALLALAVSHGISFALNFLRRGERAGATMKELMAAPYKRVVLMQLTLIFGGGAALALNDTRPVLALLVVLKILADLRGHRRERIPPTARPPLRRTAG